MPKYFDVKKAVQDGIPPAQIDSFIKQNGLVAKPDVSPVSTTQATQPTQQPIVSTLPAQSVIDNRLKTEESPSIGGFVKNIGTSALETGKGLLSAVGNVFNPNMEKNTLANIARVGLGAGEMLIPGEQGSEKYAKNVAKFYDDRYGISDVVSGDLETAKNKVLKTLYNDPVGAALDVATIVQGGGALATKAGKLSKLGTLEKAGSTISKAGEIVDPLKVAENVAGRAGLTSEKIAGGVETVGKGLEQAGKDLTVKGLRASPSQMTSFEAQTGKTLGDFISEKDLYGSGKVAAKKVDKIIEPLQKQYDGLVKTGKEIPTEVYANNLRSRAKEILSSDRSESARAVAQKLMDEADAQEKIGKTISDTVLTKTKTSTYGKVPGNAIVDPIAVNAQKEIGNVGIATLDQVSPGSAELGRQLRDLREFRDIAKTQSNIGAGSQLFNMLKPAGAGLVVGIPGGIPGMIAGTVGGAALSSPQAITTISKAMQGLGKGVSSLPSIESIPGALKANEAIAKTGRLLSPDQISNQPDNQNDQNANNDLIISPDGKWKYDPKLNAMVENKTTSQLPPITAPESNTEANTQYLTGHSPEEHYNAYIQARQVGDKKSMKAIKEDYDAEVSYQKNNKTTTKKSSQLLDIESAKSVLGSLDIDKYASVMGPITGGVRKLNPYDVTAQDFNSQIKGVAQIVGRAMEGGVLRKEDVPKYEAILPKINDTPDVAKVKMQNVLNMLEEQAKIRANQQDPTIQINQDLLPSIQ
jgi:hypothetical protein